jgi:hypothetical protein
MFDQYISSYAWFSHLLFFYSQKVQFVWGLFWVSESPKSISYNMKVVDDVVFYILTKFSYFLDE